MKLTLIAAAALALTAGAGFAQPAPPPAPAGPEGHQHPRLDPAQMAERHAEHLRAALQLRPDQEPALQALVAALKPPSDMAREHEEREADAKLPTPERLDRMQAEMGEHQARFREHAEAIKRFYAQLTPAQQKAFDALPMAHGGHHGMGEHGMRHGMRGPGGPTGSEHGPPPPPPPGQGD